MAYTLFKLKNSPYWYVDFGLHEGRRLRPSTGTQDKKAAHEFAKHREVELWRQEKLGERPRVTWDHAVIEWLKAHEHKRSIEDDRTRLRVLSEQLRGYSIAQVTPERLRKAVESLLGIGYATRNRYLSVGSTVLNFAASVKWCSPPGKISRFKEPNHRIRYLTPAEANRLLVELPDYMRPMVEFSLATGLRESNVRLLEWSNIDLERAIAWVHGDQAKAGKSLAVPLNTSAMGVLNEQFGKHQQWVFPLNGKAISGCNNKGWRGALKRAGIEYFRWHDLRHTWASWHVQNGTSLYDLKNLGGWAGMQMVERYAHMTHERVAKVAGNIDGIWQTSAKLRSDDEVPIAWNPTWLLAPRPGLEPGTCGLTVRRSTD
jgi:integrase